MARKKIVNELDDEDDNDQGGEVDNMEEQFEEALNNRSKDVWKKGGPEKDILIRKLIHYFSSMLESTPKDDAIPDHRGHFRPDDLIHRKLLDTIGNVIRATNLLMEHDNPETRDFTLFIAKKKWIKNILRPLLELCVKEDLMLALSCCSLTCSLVKAISTQVIKKIQGLKKRKKALLTSQTKSLELKNNQKNNEKNKSIELSDDEIQKEVDYDSQDELELIQNYKEQLSSLISFKEALCSEKCNQALINVFRDSWVKEQMDSHPRTKSGLGLLFIYYRSILSISSHPLYSSPSEIYMETMSHHKYIVQIRLLLSLLPAIISDLKNTYYDEWLADVVNLVYQVVRGFDPKDMFLVWQSNNLVDNFASLLKDEENKGDNKPKTNKPISSSNSSAIKVPTALTNQMKANHKASSGVGGGGLLQRLQQEKTQRQSQLPSANNRFGRFASTYQMVSTKKQSVEPLPSTAADDSDEETNTNKAVSNKSTLLVRNAFGDPINSLPQVQAKRNKKNLLFMNENAMLESTTNQIKVTSESQQACVVAASLVELLTNEACFKTFVRRINEDLRRDELRISNELELSYFIIISKLLAYNRYKLQDNYQQTLSQWEEQQHNSTSSTVATFEWKPDFVNIIDILDRMSFSRVLFTIERLSKHKETYEEIWYPLELYVEMIQYVRWLLTSTVKGHHEIALAALYRLFYSSTERLDPLPKLLALFKNVVLSKRLLFVFVEVVYQTIQTLQKAQEVFHSSMYSSEILDKNKQKSSSAANKKKELDLEQYLIAVTRFEISYYIKKIIQPGFIRMLMRLLTNIAQNPQQINQRLYSFIQMINSFAITNKEYENIVENKKESEGKNDAQSTHLLLSYEEIEANPQLSQGTEALTQSQSLGHKTKPATLGCMFYNLSCLMVFNTVLSNPSITSAASLQPIVRLLRKLIRNMMEIAQYNPMLYVEVLFPSTQPHEFALDLVSVYHADQYAIMERNRSKFSPIKRPPTSSQDTFAIQDNEPQDKVTKAIEEDEESMLSLSSENDFGDEFDENDVIVTHQTKAKKTKKSKATKKRLSQLDSSDEEVIQGNEEEVPRAARRFVRWSEAEDKVLKDLYAVYKGSLSLFYTISSHPDFLAVGERTERQIERRLRELRSAGQLAGEEGDVNSNDEDNDGDDDSDEEKINKKKKIRKTKKIRTIQQTSEDNEETERQDFDDLDLSREFLGGFSDDELPLLPTQDNEGNNEEEEDFDQTQPQDNLTVNNNNDLDFLNNIHQEVEDFENRRSALSDFSKRMTEEEAWDELMKINHKPTMKKILKKRKRNDSFDQNNNSNTNNKNTNNNDDEEVIDEENNDLMIVGERKKSMNNLKKKTNKLLLDSDDDNN